MAITISGQNNNDKILASDGVLDSISGFSVVGVMTAANFDVTGKTTTGHLNIGSDIQIGNAGIITATTLIGNVTGNINHTSNLLLQISGSEKFRVGTSGQLGIGGANYGTSGQVLTSGGSGSAATWTTINLSAVTGATGDFSIADKIVHTGDTNTALRFPAADTFTIETAGSERLRIKSDGSIGINTTGNFGSIALSIYGEDIGEGTAKGQLVIKDSAAYDASPTAGIVFQGIHAAGSQAIFAAVRGFKENSSNGNYAGALAFDVRAQGAVAYEAARIDSSGRLLVGHTSPTSVGVGAAYNMPLQVIGNSYDTAGIVAARYAADANGPTMHFVKSRNATKGSQTIVQVDDTLGFIRWYGSDGTDTTNAAAMIGGYCDATPASDKIPGRLSFWTTDTLTYPRERLRITSTGQLVTNAASSIDCGVGGMHLYLSAGARNDYSTSADGLIIEKGGNTGLSIDPGSSGTANIYFPNESNHSIASISHNNSTGEFRVRGEDHIILSTNGNTERLRITSVGEVRMLPSTGGNTTTQFSFNNIAGTPYISFKSNNVNEAAEIRIEESSGGANIVFKNKNTSGQLYSNLQISNKGSIFTTEDGSVKSYPIIMGTDTQHDSHEGQFNFHDFRAPTAQIGGWVYLGTDYGPNPYPVRTFKIAAPENSQGTRVYQVWHNGDANYDYGGLYEIRINQWANSSRFESVSIRCINGKRDDLAVVAYQNTNGIMLRTSSIWGAVYIRKAGWDDNQRRRGSSYCAVENNGALAIYNAQGTDDGTVPSGGTDVYCFDASSHTGGRDIENNNTFAG